ncbi:MAG: N-(5'-phosphoribosyl)anthranilate isomerase [Candidatus Omnitrophica bacterium]|nr:N-(5'-phosphoribosyl)anthranilate isomerase [Candidatus Omnitrophota bacterium]
MSGYVKICGVTRQQDAELAFRCGATAVGLVFAAGSKRRVTPAQARRIRRAVGPWPALVGVFVDTPAREIRAIADEAGLTAVQLHGSERPGYERILGNLLTIKAFRVGPGFAVAALRRHRAGAWLFDTEVRGSDGGTGRTFDLSLLRGVPRTTPVILAGGLHAGNVAEAVRRLRPYGVEASSRVETAPGIKDPVAMKRFITNAQKAYRTLP